MSADLLDTPPESCDLHGHSLFSRCANGASAADYLTGAPADPFLSTDKEPNMSKHPLDRGHPVVIAATAIVAGFIIVGVLAIVASCAQAMSAAQ